MAVEYFRNKHVIGELVTDITDITPNAIYVNFGTPLSYDMIRRSGKDNQTNLLLYSKNTSGELGIKALNNTAIILNKSVDDLNIVEILRTWHCWLLNNHNNYRYYFDNHSKNFNHVSSIKDFYNSDLNDRKLFFPSNESYEKPLKERLDCGEIIYKFTDIPTLIIYPDE